jgi:ribose transport system permease protein
MRFWMHAPILRKFSSLPSSVIWLLPTNIAIFVLLSATQSQFFTAINAETLMGSLAITAIIAMAQMVVIAAGGLNLALGSIGAISGMSSCYLMVYTSMPMPLTLIVGILVGALCGSLNGFIVAQFRLSPFIVTLASASLFSGVVLGLSRSRPITNLPVSFQSLGQSKLGFVPVTFILFFLTASFVAWLFFFTGLGRQILAVGGNAPATELAGLGRRRTVIAVHCLSGTLGAWAGILLLAQVGQGAPDIGTDWLLSSFAAPIIGGTLLAGGYLTVFGTCLGAALLTQVASAVVFMQLNPFWVQFIQGLIIVGAAVLDRMRIASPSRGTRTLSLLSEGIASE